MEKYFKEKERFRVKVSKVKPGEVPYHVMILKPYTNKIPYRAFCGGSIITNKRVLSSSSCYITHRKREKHDISKIRVVAGLHETTAKYPGQDDNEVQQWRSIQKIYSQKYYRSPDYSLAVVELKEEWKFNENVKEIPYASKNHDFDGICDSVVVKPSGSWSTTKELYSEEVLIITRKECEKTMQYSSKRYYCTLNRGHYWSYTEMEGSGLICHNTGDPKEKTKEEGILVGVSTKVNVVLPSHYVRVALFYQWVKDGCEKFHEEVLLVFISIVVIKLL